MTINQSSKETRVVKGKTENSGACASCVERSTKPNLKKNRVERHIDFVVSRMLKEGSNWMEVLCKCFHGLLKHEYYTYGKKINHLLMFPMRKVLITSLLKNLERIYSRCNE